MKICKKCNKKYGNELRFCPKCNKRLEIFKIEDYDDVPKFKSTSETDDAFADIEEELGELNDMLDRTLDFTDMMKEHNLNGSDGSKASQGQSEHEGESQSSRTAGARRKKKRQAAKNKRNAYADRYSSYNRRDNDYESSNEFDRSADYKPYRNDGYHLSDDEPEEKPNAFDDFDGRDLFGDVDIDLPQDNDKLSYSEPDGEATDTDRDYDDSDGRYDSDEDYGSSYDAYDEDEAYEEEYDERPAKRRRKSRRDDEPSEDEDYLRPLYENAKRGRSPLSKLATALIAIAFLCALIYAGVKLYDIFDQSNVPTKAKVSFTVKSSKDDEPLPNVKVTLLKRQSNVQTSSAYYNDYASNTTDSHGVFEIEAAQGIYKVEVDSPEYSGKQLYITVSHDLEVEFSTSEPDS